MSKLTLNFGDIQPNLLKSLQVLKKVFAGIIVLVSCATVGSKSEVMLLDKLKRNRFLVFFFLSDSTVHTYGFPYIPVLDVNAL